MSSNNLLEKVKQLRELTGVGFKDCKSAIDETNGDIEKSIELLRKKGVAKASKRMERVAAEGVIAIFEQDNKFSMVEINSETDFVAKTEDFKDLAHQITMQIAAMNPIYIDAESETNDKDIKPTSENSLLQQTFIKDSEKTIKSLIEETSGKLGENIQIKRFQRFAISD